MSELRPEECDDVSINCARQHKSDSRARPREDTDGVASSIPYWRGKTGHSISVLEFTQQNEVKVLIELSLAICGCSHLHILF